MSPRFAKLYVQRLSFHRFAVVAVLISLGSSRLIAYMSAVRDYGSLHLLDYEIEWTPLLFYQRFGVTMQRILLCRIYFQFPPLSSPLSAEVREIACELICVFELHWGC